MKSSAANQMQSSSLDPLNNDAMLMPPGVPAAQTGIMYGTDCMDKLTAAGGSGGGGGVGGGGGSLMFVPETSYSSSEGEEDFFDANDDPYTSQDKTASL